VKVIIAGGRDFTNYNLLKSKCDKILSNQKDIEIISGEASGADKLGEQYSEENNLKLKTFPANWNDFSEPCKIKYRKNGSKYNALAGHVRNQKMADYADALIAFWDGSSTGTKDMIDRAKKSNLIIRIINY
jgi:hypothetical protein